MDATLISGIIGGVTSLGGSAFDYFGSKDDVELANIQAEAIESEAKQKTKNWIIGGGIVFFIVVVIALVIISKKQKK